MNIFKFGKPPGEVRMNATFSLTPLGEKKANNFELKGDMFKITGELNAHGPCSLAEISEILRKNPSKTQQIAEIAIARGYIRQDKLVD